MIDREPRLSASVLLCCFFYLLLFAQTGAGANPQEYQVGQKLSVPGLQLPEDTYILQVQKADVSGDGTEDTVMLVGQPLKDNPSFYKMVNVVVRDGKTGAFSSLSPMQVKDYLQGYEPTMFLGDFTGDRLKDVMVTVATGGSGATSNHLITSWKNNKPVVIFGENENMGLKIKGRYLDGFKAELHSEVLKKTFIIDLSGLKKLYIDAKIYAPDGKYIYQDPSPGPNNIFSDPYSSLVPVEVDNDGVYDLQGKQNVWGPIHIFTFTTVSSTWKYKDKQWTPIDAQYTLTYSIMNNN